MSRFILGVAVLMVFACATQPKSATDGGAAVSAGSSDSSVPAPKEPEKLEPDAIIVCQGDDKRTITVEAKGTGCEVHYGKSTDTKVVASAQNGTQHCEKIRDKIADNLKNAGYRCD